MAQKVNPHFYKFGISNFWNSINYPTNKKLSSYINFNYLFNLMICFFKAYNLEVYFFKAYLNNFLNLYVYLYVNLYPKKRVKNLISYKYFIKNVKKSS